MNEGQIQFLLQSPQLVPHADPQERVQCRQGFVQKQHAGIGYQRPSQRHPLLLATGELVWQSLLVLLHVNKGEQFPGTGMALGLADAAHLETEGHVV